MANSAHFSKIYLIFGIRNALQYKLIELCIAMIKLTTYHRGNPVEQNIKYHFCSLKVLSFCPKLPNTLPEYFYI